AVEIGPDGITRPAVSVLQQPSHLLEGWRQVRAAWPVRPARDQARRDHNSAVQFLRRRLPWRAGGEILEKAVGAAEPPGCVVQPGGLIQRMVAKAGKRGIRPRLALTEEGRLPRVLKSAHGTQRTTE